MFWTTEESFTFLIVKSALSNGITTSPRRVVVSTAIEGQGFEGPDGQAIPFTLSVV